jgi:hypothetical protein
VNWLVLAGIVVTFCTSLAGAAAAWGNRRKIAEVHVLVNSQLHAVLDRVAQLTGALEQAGAPVPEAGHDVPPLPGAPPGS